MEDNNMSLKERFLELVEDYVDGTKSVKKTVEKELIKICEPIIRLRYGIAKKYNQELVEIGRDYDPSSGRIERIYEIKEPKSDNPKIAFKYRDLYKDEHGDVTEYKADIEFPSSWLEQEDASNFEKSCRQKKIDYLKIAISYQRHQVENMEKELAELLVEGNEDIN